MLLILLNFLPVSVVVSFNVVFNAFFNGSSVLIEHNIFSFVQFLQNI